MSRPTRYTPEERAAQGNPGNRPDDVAPEAIAAPVDLLTDVPPPPTHLFGREFSDSWALAKNAWDSLAPILVNARQFREGDQATLARYCRYTAEWIECTMDIDDRGMIVSTLKGEQRNPSFLARQQLEASMGQLEKELGVSPRARIAVQAKLMSVVKDLPLVGDQTNPRAKSRGPVGFLSQDDDDE